VHVHPEQIGELVQLNGLDRGDLHCPALATRRLRASGTPYFRLEFVRLAISGAGRDSGCRPRTRKKLWKS
jgi:hypothetical protein